MNATVFQTSVPSMASRETIAVRRSVAGFKIAMLGWIKDTPAVDGRPSWPETETRDKLSLLKTWFDWTRGNLIYWIFFCVIRHF